MTDLKRENENEMRVPERHLAQYLARVNANLHKSSMFDLLDIFFNNSGLKTYFSGDV